MLKRIAFATLISAGLCATSSQAGTVRMYATDPVAHAMNPTAQNLAQVIAPSAAGFFDIFVTTDVEIQALGLDVFLDGNAATLNSVELVNPNNPDVGGQPRWDPVIFHPTVAADGKSATEGLGYTLAAANRGLNPANAAMDGGYDPLAGAFHFARVNYTASDLAGAMSQIRLGISPSGDIGTPAPTTMVFYGTNAGASCNTDEFTCAGSSSLTSNGSIIVGGGVELFPDIDVSGNTMSIVNGDLTPNSLDNTDFGNAALGSVQNRSFTISNTGDADLELNALNITGDFSLVGTFPGTIGPAGSAVFQVGMGTATLGAKTGAVSFGTNVDGQPTFSFDLAGNVIPEPTSLSLLGLALIGMVGLVRRRS